MADGDLRVIVKAKELAVHSFKLTSNNNRYPKKYRHSLVDKIQIKSLEIFDTLLEANTINNITHKRNAQRKYLKMAKLVESGKMPIDKFNASYNAWINHISHGNCYKLSQNFNSKYKV